MYGYNQQTVQPSLRLATSMLGLPQHSGLRDY
jgi:hypothetical protein